MRFFARSVGVMCGGALPIAFQRSSKIRAAAFPSSALSFAKAVSIGLKSREWGQQIAQLALMQMNVRPPTSFGRLI
jgi:hypothetical protein